MLAKFEFLADPRDTRVVYFNLSILPSVGDHVTLYSDLRDEDGLPKVLTSGDVRSVLWGLTDIKGTSEVTIQVH